GARATLPRNTAPDAAGSVTVCTLAPARAIIGAGREIGRVGAPGGVASHIPPPEARPGRMLPADPRALASPGVALPPAPRVARALPPPVQGSPAVGDEQVSGEVVGEPLFV